MAVDSKPETDDMTLTPESEANFTIPEWAGKPPAGYHLDVTKGDKLVQKLMIDEKRCYYFGRNPNLCDFAVDHASCSRIHAALLYHKHLSRFFLIDLGSTHGTYIGSTRLEGRKMEQAPMDVAFHFGASTRRYVLRSKLRGKHSGDPGAGSRSAISFLHDGKSILPEEEDELENLTEYNTALNRRLTSATTSMSMIADETSNAAPRRDRRRNVATNVAFLDEEQIINPEDVDPSVGRFRNLVQTAVVPAKAQVVVFNGTVYPKSFDVTEVLSPGGRGGISYPIHPYAASESADARGSIGSTSSSSTSLAVSSLASKMRLPLPNSAPDVSLYPPSLPTPVAVPKRPLMAVDHPDDEEDGGAAKKKKYAKEAWPGKAPSSHLLG